MKTSLNKLLVLLLAAMIFPVACSESFLDVEPRGATPPEDFYKTDEEAYQGIIAAYDITQSLWGSAGNWASLYMIKTLQSDEVITGGASRSDQPNLEQFNEFTYSGTNDVIQWVFRMLYYGVYRTNALINNPNLNDLDASQTVKRGIVAEAKALRAYFYFELVTLWKEAPLVLNELTPSEYAQEFASEEALWAQIEKDLTEAIPDLPLKSEYSAADKFRVSKGTAQAMLGKALLYQDKFDEAQAPLKAVINSGEYSRLQDFSIVTRADSEFGSESIFEISYDSNQKYDWGNFNWGDDGRSTESNLHWQLLNPRGDGYFNGGSTGLIAGWGFCYPEPAMYEAFDDNDARRQYTVLSEAELNAAGGGLRLDGNLPWGCAGFIRYKYAAVSSESGPPTTELNYGMNIRVIRYADVLLMAAEACVRGNNTDVASAQQYINEVRSITNLEDVTTSNTTELFEIIKKERQLELMFEGVRFHDLKRWGMAQEVLGPERTAGTVGYPARGGYTAKNARLPIPETEKTVNPNVPDDGY